MPPPDGTTNIPMEIAVEMLQILRQLSQDLDAAEARAEARHAELKPVLEVYRRQTERIEEAQANSLARAAAAQLDQAAALQKAQGARDIAQVNEETEKKKLRQEIMAAVVKFAVAAGGGGAVVAALMHYFGVSAPPLIQNTTFSSQSQSPQHETAPADPAPGSGGSSEHSP